MQELKLNIVPKIAKKIMKPHDICTTLLLPIWVRPSRPTFSLQSSNRLARLSHIYNQDLIDKEHETETEKMLLEYWFLTRML